jgi:hypothetical protein
VDQKSAGSFLSVNPERNHAQTTRATPYDFAQVQATRIGKTAIHPIPSG